MRTRIAALLIVSGIGARASAQSVQCTAIPSAACSCAQAGIPTSQCSGTMPDVGTVSSTTRIYAGGCSSTPLVTGVEVGVQIVHTGIGDLVATLTSPSGKSAVLLYQPGVQDSAYGWQGEDIDATFTAEGDPLPDSDPFLIPAISGNVLGLDSLHGFDGEPRSGLWTLTVTDSGHNGSGGLQSWSLNLPCNRPTVVVQTPEPILFAGTDYPNAFVISRYGATNANLVVNLQILGTAVPNTDYAPLPTSVIIPAGQAEVALDVSPISGAPMQPLKDLVVIVLPGPYIVGDLALARVQLMDCSNTPDADECSTGVVVSPPDTGSGSTGSASAGSPSTGGNPGNSGSAGGAGAATSASPSGGASATNNDKSDSGCSSVNPSASALWVLALAGLARRRPLRAEA